MKAIPVFFLFLVLFQSCSGSKGTLAAQKKFPIAMAEVVQQVTTTGMKENTPVTAITIRFKKMVPKTIILKQLFFNHHRVEALKNSSTEFEFLFQGKPEATQGQDSDHSHDSLIVEPPIAIGTHQALLEYLDKGYKNIM